MLIHQSPWGVGIQGDAILHHEYSFIRKGLTFDMVNHFFKTLCLLLLIDNLFSGVLWVITDPDPITEFDPIVIGAISLHPEPIYDPFFIIVLLYPECKI